MDRGALLKEVNLARGEQIEKVLRQAQAYMLFHPDDLEMGRAIESLEMAAVDAKYEAKKTRKKRTSAAS